MNASRACVVACALSAIAICHPSCLRAADILFMQQGNNNPDFDAQLIEFIESLGHNVTPYDTGASDGEEQIALASL